MPTATDPVTAPVTTAVSCRGLGKTYPGSRGRTVEALRDIDLDIAEGEFVCIVGASGCGKSTLLRLVAGFEPVTAGSLTVRDRPVRAPGPDRGVVFQDYGLFPWLTVAGNIGYGPRQRGVSRTETRRVVERYLELVQLGKFADRFPHQLSGGMQQRVAIARVLANDPAVLLMDEPFGALDSLTREKLQLSLLQIWQQVRSTVLFITHSVEEAVLLADRVVVMSGGPNHGVPGHVAEISSIDLPQPRDVTSPEFNQMKRHLLDVVHREVAAGAAET
ncbi:ABC transporter ATP-binding protein [Solwaraspora sp. WMMD792]|uniref:ABC transporter ATP-binding protein n=1 Tax=Solwaraspora sp. WMMD792 TaxID=3016099 RepID=UPI002415CA86|nr:ABC transporter ATP-binding protein [Solwaraspora sp. WMMD792]MDG4769735.1 ABC transporter ATP-binding protein [Solwaraspora sp. WMMD792]